MFAEIQWLDSVSIVRPSLGAFMPRLIQVPDTLLRSGVLDPVPTVAESQSVYSSAPRRHWVGRAGNPTVDRQTAIEEGGLSR